MMQSLLVFKNPTKNKTLAINMDQVTSMEDKDEGGSEIVMSTGQSFSFSHSVDEILKMQMNVDIEAIAALAKTENKPPQEAN